MVEVEDILALGEWVLEKTMIVSEKTANVIENLACQIAERQGGRVSPNHLVPYLPLSMELIQDCLENMVDETAVFSELNDDIIEYEFNSYVNSPQQRGLLKVQTCLSCNSNLGEEREGSVLCYTCQKEISSELRGLSEKMGWPAQAVYEHEILYLAAAQKGPITAEALAGRSRYTLKQMKEKLRKLVRVSYVRAALDEEKGILAYEFPVIEYPRHLYEMNIKTVRSYPVSIMEEVQAKVARIFFALAILLLGLFALAFLRIPYPFLVIVFFVAGPIIAVSIWRHRGVPEE